MCNLYIWILIFYLLILIVCIYLRSRSAEFFLNPQQQEEESMNVSNPVQYKDLLLRNLERGKLTKLQIRDRDVRRTDCDEKCGEKECKIMYEQERNLKACQKCHKDPKKCYRKSISGGNCEDCLEGEAQMDCMSTAHFGCVNPHNLASKYGVNPYYVIKRDQECVFCNDFTDLI